MMMGRCQPRRKVYLVLVCLAIGTLASGENQPETTRFCESKSLPVTLAVNSPSAQLRSFSFFSSSDSAGSFADLTLTNGGNEPIIHAVVVTDFLDRSGTRLLTMPFFFRDDTRLDEEAKDHFREETDWMPIGLAERQTGVTDGVLSHALQPGESWRVASGSDILLTTCPAQARVTLVALHYLNGAVSVGSSPDLHLEPAIDMSGAISYEWGALRFSQRESPLAPGRDVLLKLRIAADGCPVIQTTDKENTITSWVQQLISGLAFVPAMDGTELRDEEIPLLIHYLSNAKPDNRWAEGRLPTALLILTLVPNIEFSSFDVPESDQRKDLTVVLLNGFPITAEPRDSKCLH